MLKQDIMKLATKVREEAPLVHNITNYVTVNDCANCILAVGGSPIMADDIEEAKDITAVSKALVLNIGTLNKRTIDSMLSSGKTANQLGIPVIFDPVGAGASAFRNETAKKILEQVKLSIIRGNLSEIAFIAGLETNTKGVDVSKEDEKKDKIQIARKAAREFHCTVAITGKEDVISNGKRTALIRNGHPIMAKVTGTGCMTTAITGAYCGVHTDAFVAAVTGIAAMGIAGELSYEKNQDKGTGSIHIGIIDELSKLNSETIKERIILEEL